jgi:hypothetical protein
MSSGFGLVIPDVQFVIPDSIRDPVPHHHWIAGQARNDKTMCKIWLVWRSAQRHECEGTSRFLVTASSAKIGFWKSIYNLWKEKSHARDYTSWR